MSRGRPAAPAPSPIAKTCSRTRCGTGLSAYALAPGRAARFAEPLPADAAARQTKREAQAAVLTAKLKQPAQPVAPSPRAGTVRPATANFRV